MSISSENENLSRTFEAQLQAPAQMQEKPVGSLNVMPAQQVNRNHNMTTTETSMSSLPATKAYPRSLPKLLPLAPKLPYPGSSSQAQPSNYFAPHLSAAPLKKKEKKCSMRAKAHYSPPRNKAKIIGEKSNSCAIPVAKSSIVESHDSSKISPVSLCPQVISEPLVTLPEESVLEQMSASIGIDEISAQSMSPPLPQIKEQDPQDTPHIATPAVEAVTTAPSTAETSLSDSPIDVETNPDYIALTSALSLLQTQRSVACNDLIQLKKLKSDALEMPELFVASLKRTGKLQNVPKMQRITRAPIISWKKYRIENAVLDHRLARGLVERQSVFNPVRLFDDQS